MKVAIKDNFTPEEYRKTIKVYTEEECTNLFCEGSVFELYSGMTEEGIATTKKALANPGVPVMAPYHEEDLVEFWAVCSE